MDDKNRGKRRGLALLLCNMYGKLKPTSTKKIKGVPMTVFCNKNTQKFVPNIIYSSTSNSGTNAMFHSS